MLRRCSVLIGILVLAGMIQIAAGQDRNATEIIKVDTRLVSVPVTVSDRNGRYVPGLTEADFTLYQDGVKQNIDFFGATEEPLTIALLIDTSQSTRPVLADIKDSAHAFLKLLQPRDRAMVVSFDYDTHVLSGLTTDKETASASDKKCRYTGRTVSARHCAMRRFKRSTSRLRALRGGRL